MGFKYTEAQRAKAAQIKWTIKEYKGNEFCVSPMNLNTKPTIKKNGAFYINHGYSGCNSPTNNGFGYKTEQSAINAILRYQAKF